MNLYPDVPFDMFTHIENVESPAIVYDYRSLLHTIDYLNNEKKKYPNISLHVALKANYNIKLHAFIKDKFDGVDVASLEEFKLAKKIGYENISITSPNISKGRFKYLLEHNINTIIFDSKEQLIDFINLKKSMENTHVKLGLRIKIPLSKQNTNTSTYFSDSRFGILLEDSIVSLLKKNEIQIDILHCHVGELDNLNNIAAIINYFSKVTGYFPNISAINIGGGLTSIFGRVNARNFFCRLDKFRKNILHSGIKLILEPGMLIFSFSGYLKTSIVSIKEDEIVTLDSSAFNLNCWNFPYIAYNSSSKEESMYRICGSTCYEADIFFEQVKTNKLTTNDFLVMFPYGAYINSTFRTLHIDKPFKEYLFKNNELMLL